MFRQAAMRALAAGITTIRDLGDRNYLSLTLRDWFREETGPRIIASGPPITVTGGHCWFLGGEADGEDGVRAAVRDRVARGVDVIKIMATGGNMTPTLGPHQSQYTRAELAAAVDEAHALPPPAPWRRARMPTSSRSPATRSATSARSTTCSPCSPGACASPILPDSPTPATLPPPHPALSRKPAG